MKSAEALQKSDRQARKIVNAVCVLLAGLLIGAAVLVEIRMPAALPLSTTWGLWWSINDGDVKVAQFSPTGACWTKLGNDPWMPNSTPDVCSWYRVHLQKP